MGTRKKCLTSSGKLCKHKECNVKYSEVKIILVADKLTLSAIGGV